MEVARKLKGSGMREVMTRRLILSTSLPLLISSVSPTDREELNGYYKDRMKTNDEVIECLGGVTRDDEEGVREIEK